MDFSAELSALKSKMEYSLPDLNLPKSYAPDALASLRKMDFSASDLSISSIKTPKLSDSFSMEGATPPKVPKTDYGMLDLSLKSELESHMDLSSTMETNSDQPLNLAE